jgi:hypothetical protein
MADAKKPAKAMRSGIRELEIRTRRMVDDSMAGAYHSVFKGRGMDFDEVREYSPGDEVRTIDWNVTARAGRPFVKKFTEERELTIFLVVDISASGNFGSGAMAKRDLAAEVASVLAFSAIRNSDKVGLILYTDRIERYLPPKKGRRHVLRVVRDILYHEPQGTGTDTVKMLDTVNHVLHRRAVVFLISDFETSGDPGIARANLRRAVRQTNRRHDLIAVHIEDPREKELPNVGIIALEDAETGEIIELDTANVRRVYGAICVARGSTPCNYGRMRPTFLRCSDSSNRAAVHAYEGGCPRPPRRKWLDLAGLIVRNRSGRIVRGYPRYPRAEGCAGVLDRTCGTRGRAGRRALRLCCLASAPSVRSPPDSDPVGKNPGAPGRHQASDASRHGTGIRDRGVRGDSRLHREAVRCRRHAADHRGVSADAIAELE